MPLPLVLKVVALGTAAATGAGGLVWSATADRPEGQAAVWVDDPLVGSTVPIGVLPVLAHASSKDPLSALELLVDGKAVSKDDSLERNGLLSVATFSWDAVAGSHTLVVRATDGGTRSEPVQINVSDLAPAPSTTPTPGTTGAPSPSPSATSSPTPSASASASLTAEPSASPAPTTAGPSPTPVRTSAPPRPTPSPTPSPRPSPPGYVSGSIAFNPSFFYWDVNSAGGPCSEPNNTTATVRVDRATNVSIVVGGTFFPATAGSGNTWTAAIDPALIPGSRTTRAVPVSVEARGPGGGNASSAGTVTIYSCTKD